MIYGIMEYFPDTVLSEEVKSAPDKILPFVFILLFLSFTRAIRVKTLLLLLFP